MTRALVLAAMLVMNLLMDNVKLLRMINVLLGSTKYVVNVTLVIELIRVNVLRPILYAGDLINKVIAHLVFRCLLCSMVYVYLWGNWSIWQGTMLDVVHKSLKN